MSRIEKPFRHGDKMINICDAYRDNGSRFNGNQDFAIGTVVGVATPGVFLTVGLTVLFPRITHYCNGD